MEGEYGVICQQVGSRMTETALARGMDQPDAWNTTFVEWVRAATVTNNIYIISYKNYATFRYTIIFECYK